MKMQPNVGYQHSPLILLQGYYGAGNFGDDILMVVTYSILKNIFSPGEICIKTVSPASYIYNLINKNSHVIYGEPLPTSLKISLLGGGGLFFDFQRGDLRGRVNQFLLHNLGIKKTSTTSAFQTNFSQMQSQIIKRAAFCIGLGPFGFGSAKELTTASLLSNYDLIITRDRISTNLSRLWQLPGNIVEATDAAFLTEYWLSGIELGDKPVSRDKRIGFIIRDWNWNKHGARYFKPLVESVQHLKSKGFDVSYISFNPPNDRDTLNKLKEMNEKNVICWTPDEMSIKDFLLILKQFDLFVTSRAHGAIIAACLGIPSICVAIEPKLERVYEMIYPGAEIWKNPFNSQVLVKLVDKMIVSRDGYTNHLNNVLKERKNEALKGSEALYTFLNKARDSLI